MSTDPVRPRPEVIEAIRARQEKRRNPDPYPGTCSTCGHQQPIPSGFHTMASSMAESIWRCERCGGQLSATMTVGGDAPTADDDIETLLKLLPQGASTASYTAPTASFDTSVPNVADSGELDALRQQLAEAVQCSEHWRTHYDAALANWNECLGRMQAAEAKLAEAEELHRMQLAAVTATALGNTRSTASERIGRENPYWTAAYHDVCNAVDREIEHREKLAEASTENREIHAMLTGKGEMGWAMSHPEGPTTEAGKALSKLNTQLLEAEAQVLNTVSKNQWEALTTALSALEQEMRAEGHRPGNYSSVYRGRVWADKLAALLAAHTEKQP